MARSRYEFTADTTEAWTLDDTDTIGRNMGFIPNADGSFVGKARGDSTTRTFNVLGGVIYPVDIMLAQDTSKSGVASLLILRQS